MVCRGKVEGKGNLSSWLGNEVVDGRMEGKEVGGRGSQSRWLGKWSLDEGWRWVLGKGEGWRWMGREI